MKISVSVIQCHLQGEWSENYSRIEELCLTKKVTSLPSIICIPELPAGTYFPQTQTPEWFETATTLKESQVVSDLQKLSKLSNSVIPASFFERDGNEYFNSVAVIDCGEILGVYRKTHIPDGPGYQEKYYFTPSRNGFKVWNTSAGVIGVGICWDQWFPECARSMALMGADVLLYPTAIGSEPAEPGLDSRKPWQRVMQGHAVANTTVIAAANRIGTEDEITFYGQSFIADQQGSLVVEAHDSELLCSVDFDLKEIRKERASWGFFRDRRPEYYKRLTEESS